jgi:hypothetical protein
MKVFPSAADDAMNTTTWSKTIQNIFGGTLDTLHMKSCDKAGSTKLATREFSSSSVSNSVGTPSPTPTSLQDSSTTDQLEPVGDALALIPTVGDEACTDHSP